MTSARWHATAATSALSILDVLGLTGTGAACPVDCPLCECIVVVNYDGDDYDANSTAVAAATTKDVDDCAYDKSIEACASGTLAACYNLHRPAGLSASGGDATADASYNVAGLCDVRCAGDDDGAAEDASAMVQCRLCDIFRCCESCSADGAAGCFPPPPPPANEGDEDDSGAGGGDHTPAGWKPAACDGGDAGRGGGISNGAIRRRTGTPTTVALSFALVASLAIASIVS